MKLRTATPALANLRSITKAGGGSNGTLGRLQLAKTAANIDTLEQLAAAFHIEPWQLLHPNIEVTPRLKESAVFSRVQDWPFALIDRGRYEQLDAEHRGFIQAKIEEAITHALLKQNTQKHSLPN